MAVSVTVWIIVAFILGMLFGRLTARGSGARADGPAGPRPNPGVTVPIVGSPDGAYRVMLLDSGPNKINSIKAVREITRLDLKGSKDLVDATPRELIRVSSAAEAETIAQRFQGVASVRVDGPAGTPSSAGPGYVSETVQ